MSIKKLPKHLINKLKAWEIVERPASIVKELVENSIDAGATSISISIKEWGKKYICIKDNGSGMKLDDLAICTDRYTTSKIFDEADLESLESYGFRGEALASISEVSLFRIQTRNKDDDLQSWMWYELYRADQQFVTKKIPFAQESGTNIFIEDIFYSVPARLKFLKSDQTEWKYIKDVFYQFSLCHYDKERILENNGKKVKHLPARESLMERILDITKKEREQNLKELAYQQEGLEMYGLAWSASLHFPAANYFWIFVNGRPVQDRLIKRAVMQAYQRQIVPGSYPFICLFIQIDPKKVDVNVHPRKLEVKFLDPWSMFTNIERSIREAIGESKVNYAAFTKHPIQSSKHYTKQNNWMPQEQMLMLKESGEVRKSFLQQESLLSHEKNPLFTSQMQQQEYHISHENTHYKVIGQIRDMYILLEAAWELIYVDQHALAERINFEKMRKKVQDEWFQSDILLQAMSLEVPANLEIEPYIDFINKIWFDASRISESKIVIYAIPKVFSEYKVDVQIMMNRVRGVEFPEKHNDPQEIFGLMVDEILWMKACKASIKAGQRLSHVEMKQLMEDAYAHIDWMFVCQHGRPSVVSIKKHDVDSLFERH